MQSNENEIFLVSCKFVCLQCTHHFVADVTYSLINDVMFYEGCLLVPSQANKIYVEFIDFTRNSDCLNCTVSTIISWHTLVAISWKAISVLPEGCRPHFQKGEGRGELVVGSLQFLCHPMNQPFSPCLICLVQPAMLSSYQMQHCEEKHSLPAVLRQQQEPDCFKPGGKLCICILL